MNIDSLKPNRSLRFYCIIFFILIGIPCLFFTERQSNKPIIIGFSGQLTGRQAELGVQERNGIQLAVEKINKTGGISGRNISLIANDDLGTSVGAQTSDSVLISKGAVAIIGHTVSVQTISALKITNPAKEVMIGPTVSTPELSEWDDYFFRVYPSLENGSKNLANYIYNNKINNMAIIYDKDNSEYAGDYSTVFSNNFQVLGGQISDIISFSSNSQPDFTSILKEMVKTKAQGLLIVASDIDTALIAQNARLINWQVPLFSSSWAQTDTLINNGGKAVEGMKIQSVYRSTNASEAFKDFEASYRARFGTTPSFGAVYSYDAASILFNALKKTNGTKHDLKEALLETHNFKGLLGTISFDKYGDVAGSSYLTTINNGQFVPVNNTNSSNLGSE